MRPEQLAKRDGWVCWLCQGEIDPDAPVGSPTAATVDHVVPKSRGGATTPTNLRLAHRRCNGRRGNHLPELAWPDHLGLLDAPPLWRSLRHLVPSRRSRSKRAKTRRAHDQARPLVVALAPTAETAAEAGHWATETAERFLGGRWTATTSATGVADCHVVKLSVDGPVLDPGNPLT